MSYFTKYERTMLIAQRAQDIAEGAVVNVPYKGHEDAYTLAKMEYSAGAIPYDIVRQTPSGEQITVSHA